MKGDCAAWIMWLKAVPNRWLHVERVTSIPPTAYLVGMQGRSLRPRRRGRKRYELAEAFDTVRALHAYIGLPPMRVVPEPMRRTG